MGRADPFLQDIADKTEALKEAERHQVDLVRRCRREGKSWTQVALALGMTRQGAQQQFGRYCQED